jgi:TetR/AcrR family transcriptional repressor of nem operon
MKTGRPRQFDEAEVLERAMDLFWQRGYEATGLGDLLEVMDIGRQSLYTTFGDKHGLFMRALDHYLDKTLAEASATIAAASSPSAALRDWLRGSVVSLCFGQEEARACFALNTVVERCPHDDEVTQRILTHFQAASALIAGTIARGQASGEFRSDQGAADLAAMVMSAAAGLMVTSKLSVPLEHGERTVALLLDMLTLPEG